MAIPPRLIALDWGTSSFRAHRLDASGAVLDSRRTADGILSVKDGAFEAVLRRNIGDWLTPAVPCIASGMITSRQGWVETPYVSCPASGDAIAAAVVRHQLSDGIEIAFVPGIRMPTGIRDVIRGEETQLLGLGRDCLAVHPGTHGKWASVDGGRITEFVTFMTGELFAALMDHTILGRLAEGRAHDRERFKRGVLDGARAGDLGAITHALFGGRTLALAGELPAHAVASYISGLLIGAECAAAARLVPHADRVPILFGEDALVAVYREAFDALGRDVIIHTGDATIAGLSTIARVLKWL